MNLITPTAEQIAEARADYQANAFGYADADEYAMIQFPRHTAAFQAAIASAIR